MRTSLIFLIAVSGLVSACGEADAEINTNTEFAAEEELNSTRGALLSSSAQVWLLSLARRSLATSYVCLHAHLDGSRPSAGARAAPCARAWEPAAVPLSRAPIPLNPIHPWFWSFELPHLERTREFMAILERRCQAETLQFDRKSRKAL